MISIPAITRRYRIEQWPHNSLGCWSLGWAGGPAGYLEKSPSAKATGYITETLSHSHILMLPTRMCLLCVPDEDPLKGQACLLCVASAHQAR